MAAINFANDGPQAAAGGRTQTNAGYFYAIRLPANAVLKDKIAHRLTRPVGRPSQTKVKRYLEDFEYQAQSWDKERRVIAKIEWHPGVCATADAALSEKRLSSGQNQAISTSDGRPLGECRLKCSPVFVRTQFLGKRKI